MAVYNLPPKGKVLFTTQVSLFYLSLLIVSLFDPLPFDTYFSSLSLSQTSLSINLHHGNVFPAQPKAING